MKNIFGYNFVMDVLLTRNQCLRSGIVLHYVLGILKCTVEFVWRVRRGKIFGGIFCI